MVEGALRSADMDVLDRLGRSGLDGMPLDDLVSGFCERARDGGVPLARVQVGTAIVHPLTRGYSRTWWHGRGIAETESFGHDQQPAAAWYRSPGAYMFTNDVRSVGMRLDRNERGEPWFPLYDDLIEAGLTEYYTEVFPFGWASMADRETEIPELGVITSWSADRPGGFGDDLVRLKAMLPLFALAVKSKVMNDMSETLMTTYLGRDAGERVLHGDIHRGDTRILRAAILLADLRGFTALTERLSSETMVAMLNDYLEAICEPVQQRGGQVLKFLGDGLLAVFDDAEGDRAEAALQAAREALSRVAEINRSREGEGQASMALDIALHAGEVAYGNVGARDRLDFTVIGPAVNEAARMEAMCGTLGRHLLLSAEFAGELADAGRLNDLGEHTLKGVSRPRRLYGWSVDD